MFETFPRWLKTVCSRSVAGAVAGGMLLNLAGYAVPIAAAAAPSFSTSATLSANLVAPGTAETVSWSVTSTTAMPITIGMAIYDNKGTSVASQQMPNESFTAGQKKTYTYVWNVPAAQALGSYSVQIGVFSPDWSTSYLWNSNAAQINVGIPSFNTAATLSASLAAPGTPETVSWSVTSAATMPATVGMAIYDNKGTSIASQQMPNEAFAAGQTKTYSFTWNVPAAQALGTYSVQIGVFSPDWSKQYVWNNNAAQINVAVPSFSTAATLSASLVVPGATETVSWSVTSAAPMPVTVGMAIYDTKGNSITSQRLTSETFAAGQTKTYTYAWNVPAAQALGTYSVQIGVFSPDGTKTYIWNNNAAQINVAVPSFTTAATLSASPAVPGSPETVSWSVTSAATMPATVGMAIYDNKGNSIASQQMPNEAFSAGQTKTYTFTWNVPAAQALGAYSVQVGVFSPDWSKQYVWNNNAAQINVAVPSFSTAATVSVSAVAPGTAETVSWSVTSAAAMPVTVGMAIYDNIGNSIASQRLTSETFTAGQTKTYTFVWNVPAAQALGMYTVQIGVFTPDGSKTYVWNNSAAQISVANAAFTLAATTSASSVAPGSPETINWTVQSATATNTSLALDVFDVNGKAVASQRVPNEAFGPGQTKNYTYVWNVPANEVVGTHTVQLTVRSADGATTYGTNANAVQFGVIVSPPGGTTPSFTTSAVGSPRTVSPGGATAMTWSVQSLTAITVSFSLDIFDNNGATVFVQNVFSETFWAGQTKTYTYTWNVPAQQALGTYSVQIGVFNPDFSSRYVWNGAAGIVRVTAPNPAGYCSPTLQEQIDAAPAGSVVNVAACIYREDVVVDKALTLVAKPGTEIRGSDVWSTWTSSGANWVAGTLPPFAAVGICNSTSPLCTYPGQVFIDGKQLTYVANNPAAGQWTSDGSRNVVLADNPTGHTVEVSTRSAWVNVSADNVVIQGFTMQQLANNADTGGIMAMGVKNMTVQGSTLAYAHGADIAVDHGSGHKVLNNDIHHGGQIGIGANITDAMLIQSNKIHDNNTAGFSAAWGSSGVKLAGSTNSTMDSNQVYNNAAHGLWCDIQCSTIVFSNNRIYDNANQGIHFEVSNGAKIWGNVLWNNSVGDNGWGANIFVCSSSNAEIYNNLVFATRTHGIFVCSTNRTDYPSAKSVVGNYAHDNTVIMNGTLPGGLGRTALAWAQNFAGVMYDPASNNRGSNNGFWFSYPEPSWERFSWNGSNGEQSTLAAFAATSGGAGSFYLSTAQRDQVLTAAVIPASAWNR